MDINNLGENMNNKKEEINILNYSKEILESLARGVLLTTASGNELNVMTISWGTLGYEWGKNIITIYIRNSRYTKELLDKSMEFTINIPDKHSDKKVIGYCGTKSGRNVDKFAELNLTKVNSDIINTPGIKEFPITLECKVIFKQEQNQNLISNEIKNEFYKDDNYHTVYYGEIVKSYIIK